ncbi:putative dNA helicase/exodeoxyribonuclease V [Mycobacterium xenopi 4042]|uniref:Putative dNA helicase/exodeoxyribonuclease V n=1 Tax=Mycobacterium xenopi 4042 TaxID=1299334 RepID=X7Z3L8_MYCXE|nr:putative dNA helicase/exodeoxyribonuclease V [Mycobacterium xenopi 4042]
MPVEISALQEWIVGDRMLHDMLRGIDARTAAEFEWRRGTLPPGQLGWRKAKKIRDRAAKLAEATLRARHGEPRAHDVAVDLGDGRSLTGTVTPVFGDRIVEVTYSKLDGRHLLQCWLRLLALAADEPSRAWTAMCIGRRDTDTDRVKAQALRAPGNAVEILRELATLYDNGRREPLPLPVKTSYAWARAATRAPTREQPPAAGGFRRTTTVASTRSRPSKRLSQKGAARRAARAAAPGEEMPGEDTRLGALAARLWSPLIQATQEPG